MAGSLGLADDVVALADHDARWGLLFRREAEALRAALGRRAIAIEHVGSTSISGIRAKPILDVLLAIADLEDHAELVAHVGKLDYIFRPNAGLPAELVFVKGTPRTHILHVVAWDSDAWRQKLAFRNALRADPALAAEYDALKASLAAQFENDRTAYTTGKTEFVRRVVSACAPHSAFLTRD